MQNGGDNVEDGVLLLLGESKGVHGDVGELEFLGIVLRAGKLVLLASFLDQVVVVLSASQAKRVLLSNLHSRQDLVENVEVTLTGTTVADTGLLEQVVLNAGTRNLSLLRKGDLDELSEAGRVIVLAGAGVTNGLEERIGIEETVVQRTVRASGSGLRFSSGVGQILDHTLGVLGLTGTRFTTNCETRSQCMN